jgi:RluA family pseudouridine synthase
LTRQSHQLQQHSNEEFNESIVQLQITSVAGTPRFFVRSPNGFASRMNIRFVIHSLSHESMPQIRILAETDTYVVVDKPTGLLSQAVRGLDSALVQCQRHACDAGSEVSSSTPPPTIRLVHRIDRGTSGCLLFAKTLRAARLLSDQFAVRSVQKKYWAVLVDRERTLAETGRLEDHMRKVPDEARAELVDCDHADARRAALTYQVIARSDALVAVEVELETGRTHQIRLQFGSRGKPILGDRLYGSELAWEGLTTEMAEQQRRDIGRLPTEDERVFEAFALHALSIGFRDPANARPVSVLAPLPSAWQSSNLPADLASELALGWRAADLSSSEKYRGK